MPSKPRGGLGRGLDALIPKPDAPEPEAPPAEAHPPPPNAAPVGRIGANPYQPRSRMDEAELDGLASSIREHGVLQPLLVQRDGEGYRLIAGHRRLEAARRAGLAEVPIIVRPPDPRENVLVLALVENLQRADLGPLDEAAAYRELARRFELSTEEIAARTGKARSTVANSLRLLDLSPEVKELLEDGRLTEGHARALLALRDWPAQARAGRTVVDQGLNVRQTEALVKQLATERPRRAASVRDAHLEALESRFRERLGTRVSLSGTPRGGRITIHYYSEDELAALYAAIVREE